MSFILDALKKSEIERQRQAVPGLMETRMVQRRSRLPTWAIALGVLLGINLIVLLVVVTRSGAPLSAQHGNAVPSRAAPAAAASAAPPANAHGADHFSPLDTTPVYAPEIPVASEDETEAPAMGHAAPIERAGSGAAAVGRVHRADPVLSDANAAADNQEVLPSISELSLTGPQALPELHLDVHVYATKPIERFVYINMRKYHEGATLQEGPTIEHIRRDGVVLNFHGLRFILPRQ